MNILIEAGKVLGLKGNHAIRGGRLHCTKLIVGDYVIGPYIATIANLSSADIAEMLRVKIKEKGKPTTTRYWNILLYETEYEDNEFFAHWILFTATPLQKIEAALKAMGEIE